MESGQTLVKIKTQPRLLHHCFYCVFSLYHNISLCAIFSVLYYIEPGIALKYGLPRDQYKIVQRSDVKKQLEVQRVGEKINKWLMKNKSVFEVEENVFFKGNLILNSYK